MFSNDNRPQPAPTGSAFFVPKAPAPGNAHTPIVVGSFVSCILPHAGEGIVSEIHGVQAPETVRTLGNGIAVQGGRASFDVVWLNGNRSKQVPEAIIRGVQWKVRGSVAGDNELKSALAFADQEDARKAREATDAATAHAAELDRLRTAPEFAALDQGDDRYSGKLAAKNIRQQLKAAFPRTRFSVRKLHHGSVLVAWTDGPTTKQVEQIASRYQGGSFDGMQDLYVSSKSPWCEVFGGADYISTTRDYSDAMVAPALAAVLDRYAGNFDKMPAVTVEDYRTAALQAVPVPGLHTAYGVEDLQSLVRQQLAQTDAGA
ncbi:LPD29 domain-containing protein [Roseomonas mucosa]|uniref:LPD29 domain-containing protein n=1 Tax=Roseomonas mucosa TaxID=207340 RepID=UPI0022486255|nr:LPD29 domain-containing protein [Roseomonas mucosa]